MDRCQSLALASAEGPPIWSNCARQVFIRNASSEFLTELLGPQELTQRDPGDRAMMPVIRHYKCPGIVARHEVIDQSMFRIEKILGAESL